MRSPSDPGRSTSRHIYLERRKSMGREYRIIENSEQNDGSQLNQNDNHRDVQNPGIFISEQNFNEHHTVGNF